MAVNRLNVGATNQLLAKASTGQSTNILELQNTAGVTVAGVDASGNGVGGLAHPPTFKNLIINGAMQVAQRGTSVTGVTASGYYTADRWNLNLTTQGTWTQSVENDAPTGSGFRKSLKVLCTTADAAPAATDQIRINQNFEGQNLQSIRKGTSSAQQVTLSFWVKSNVTGTYIIETRDIDNDRSISASYSVASSGTWEKKTIVFSADTTGAFDNDNGQSLQINWWLGGGTDFTSGTLNTSWGSRVAANVAVGQTNLAASTNNYWQVTGVQLEVGNTATEFEFMPIDAELAQCQRYYFRNNFVTTSDYGWLGTAISTTQVNMPTPIPTTMRTTPTSVDYASIRVFDGVNAAQTISAVSLLASAGNPPVIALTATGLTQYRPYTLLANTLPSYVGISAEL
jgi:hypothetical protein